LFNVLINNVKMLTNTTIQLHITIVIFTVMIIHFLLLSIQ